MTGRTGLPGKEINMNKVTVKIDGMMCRMCEAHIADAIRRAFPEAKKVAASRKRGEATFVCEDQIENERIKALINDTGYTFVSVSAEPFRKYSIFRK